MGLPNPLLKLMGSVEPIEPVLMEPLWHGYYHEIIPSAVHPNFCPCVQITSEVDGLARKTPQLSEQRIQMGW